MVPILSGYLAGVARVLENILSRPEIMDLIRCFPLTLMKELTRDILVK